MKRLVTFLNVFITIILLITLKLCCPKDDGLNLSSNFSNNEVFLKPILSKRIIVKKDVLIENYFNYLDSIVVTYEALTTYNLTEHLLVRANPWIMDTLKNTDYYRMMARDSFVYNQKKMIALPHGNLIVIPD